MMRLRCLIPRPHTLAQGLALNLYMKEFGRKHCHCLAPNHEPKLVVITGGPGGGKTATLELARRSFCKHTAILPEAASILFVGGFWRHDTLPAKKALQRSIYFVQREQERMVIEEKLSGLILCDRGTLDSLAYWPNSEDSFFKELGTTLETELAKYAAVIHLCTPSAAQGYNHQNPVRIENAVEAAEIDTRILEVWEKHPNRFVIESNENFFKKAEQVLEVLQKTIPPCCKPK